MALQAGVRQTDSDADEQTPHPEHNCPHRRRGDDCLRRVVLHAADDDLAVHYAFWRRRCPHRGAALPRARRATAASSIAAVAAATATIGIRTRRRTGSWPRPRAAG